MVNQLDSSMARRFLAAAVAFVLALGIWGLGSRDATAATWKVEAKNFAFTPPELTVAVGDTVTWTNGDSESHAVQGGSMSSPEIVSGGSFSKTFTTAEDFTYFCRFHTYMTGTIHVVAGGGATSTTSPITTPPSSAPPGTSPTTAPGGGTTTTTGVSPTAGSTFQEVPDDPSARKPPGPGIGASSSVGAVPSAASAAPAAGAAASAAVRPVDTAAAVDAALGTAPQTHGDAAASPSSLVSVSAQVDARHLTAAAPPSVGTSLGDGTQLAPSKNVDGVVEFHLTMAETTVEVSPGVVKQAYAFNGIVPGPVIRVAEGDRVRIVVENKLPFPTSTHWHGMILPNDQDGVGEVTQPSIQPGQSYTYEWTAVATGTHWYHSHSSGRHIGKGLYGVLEVVPSKGDFRSDRDYRLMIGDTDLGFVLNGRSFPSTPTLETAVGETVRLRVVNTGDQVHAMHLHGVPFTVVAQDGMKRVSPERMDTLTISPGQTFDLLFRQAHPGKWLIHCHMFMHSHMSEDTHPPGESGMTGMVAIVNTAPATGGSGLAFLPISAADLPGAGLIAVIALGALVGSFGSFAFVRRIRQS